MPLCLQWRVGGARLLALAGLTGLAVSLPAAEVVLHRRADRGWELRRDGTPFVVRGVSGWRHLDEACAAGANTLRTWGVGALAESEDGQPLLDRAHARGLVVMVGLWLQHESSAFRYDREADLLPQREAVRAAVRRHRDHPAVLLWGLGNEMEGPAARAATTAVWREVELLARIIKEEDPHHPIITVIAGAEPEKIRQLRLQAPSVDLVGINAYGSAPTAVRALDEAGWDGPFMLTEFGAPGWWEARQTAWGAPIEPTPAQKLGGLLAAFNTVQADPRRRGLGTFPFLWGQKQEATESWFGLFLATGERTPGVDEVARAYRGRWPANRSPRLSRLRSSLAAATVPAGSVHAAEVQATDPEGDPLSFEWRVVEESRDRRAGGAREQVPPDVPDRVTGAGSAITVRAPDRPGAYRLFVTVRDGQGGGCSDNLPFAVE